MKNIVIFLVIITTFGTKSYSTECDVLFNKALKAQSAGDHKLALNYIFKYAKQCREDVIFHYIAGESYFALKKYFLAFKHYIAMYGNDPRFKRRKEKMLILAKLFLTPEEYAELIHPLNSGKLKFDKYIN